MARPLRDGSRAEPTAAVSGSRVLALGGTVALSPPVCRTQFAVPPGLNCALCPAGPLPPRALYRCMRGPEPPRSRSSQAHGRLENSPTREPPAEQPNPAGPRAAPRAPSTAAPSLEQALGARLRRLGDQFHREHQRPRPQQQQGPPAWAPFSHFLLQLLGLFFNLPAERGLGFGPN